MQFSAFLCVDAPSPSDHDLLTDIHVLADFYASRSALRFLLLHDEGFPSDLDPIARIEFSSPSCFDLAVYSDQSLGDDDLRLASRGYGADSLEKTVQLDVFGIYLQFWNLSFQNLRSHLLKLGDLVFLK
jgi:hypothetical protein